MRRVGSLALTLLAALEFVSAAPQPPTVVVLKDGTRYALSKPYEIRGAQARLPLANGQLVSVRASEIDAEATKRASSPPALNTGSAPPSASAQRPAEIGRIDPGATSSTSLGARVKLDKEKADTLFRQDVAPAPVPVATGTPASGIASPEKDGFATAMKAEAEAETTWRAREAERLSRLDAALESQREICARYTSALASAGTQDGRVSDAAGAILGALQADCDTATRRADAIRAERGQLEEECRRTYGCKPGWLR